MIEKKRRVESLRYTECELDFWGYGVTFCLTSCRSGVKSQTSKRNTHKMMKVRKKEKTCSRCSAVWWGCWWKGKSAAVELPLVHSVWIPRQAAWQLLNTIKHTNGDICTHICILSLSFSLFLHTQTPASSLLLAFPLHLFLTTEMPSSSAICLCKQRISVLFSFTQSLCPALYIKRDAWNIS